MDKQELKDKINRLQGLTNDEKSYLINLVNTKKKYGLVWEEKEEDVEEELRENLPVLKEVKDKAILNGEDNPNHILIEGDNLHALTALTFTHEGKIDVIYIDPPYNTGNKDFKYNDSFVDKEDSYRHSKWLSFMHKRLEIAKLLLKESGVVFISIDDNEQAQLKMLCDDLFGENHFVADFIWKRRASSALADFKVSTDHEFIYCYQKGSFNYFKGISKEFKGYNNPDKDPRGDWTSGDLTVGMNKALRPNQFYDLVNPKTGKKYSPNPNRVWSYIPNSMEKLIREDRIIFPDDNTRRPMLKRFKSELKENVNPVSTLISNIEGQSIGINSEGTRQLQDIFDDSPFGYPKPLSLIKFFLDQLPYTNSTILDFFAGSGTTLHATMQLNAEDNGNRQCILVTNNENNICEEVTYERNKRVIQGYTNSKGEEVKGLQNNNLRYYKSHFVSRDTSVKNKKELTKLATELLCIKEDCYNELKQLAHWELNSNNVRCFYHTNFYMLIIYDEELIEQVVEVIKSTIEQAGKQKLLFKIYVFSNGQYPYTEEFEEVLPYITLCALPDAIYKAYQNVLPKKKKQPVLQLEDEAESPAS